MLVSVVGSNLRGVVRSVGTNRGVRNNNTRTFSIESPGVQPLSSRQFVCHSPFHQKTWASTSTVVKPRRVFEHTSFTLNLARLDVRCGARVLLELRVHDVHLTRCVLSTCQIPRLKPDPVSRNGRNICNRQPVPSVITDFFFVESWTRVTVVSITAASIPHKRISAQGEHSLSIRILLRICVIIPLSPDTHKQLAVAIPLRINRIRPHLCSAGCYSVVEGCHEVVVSICRSFVKGEYTFFRSVVTNNLSFWKWIYIRRIGYVPVICVVDVFGRLQQVLRMPLDKTISTDHGGRLIRTSINLEVDWLNLNLLGRDVVESQCRKL